MEIRTRGQLLVKLERYHRSKTQVTKISNFTISQRPAVFPIWLTIFA